jgi:hypothetical protein
VTDGDVATLMAFFRDAGGPAKSGRYGAFQAGIQSAVRRLLVSPEFLLRVERDPVNAVAGAPYRISDIELASRLSFFLWSSIPDDELLTAAERGQLREPAVLTAQVKRMLADRRSQAFVSNFAGQWLFLRNLQAVVPVQNIFPTSTTRCGNPSAAKPSSFSTASFATIAASSTCSARLHLPQRTAGAALRHPNVKGSHFRRVSLGPNSVRSGILGQAAILTVTFLPRSHIARRCVASGFSRTCLAHRPAARFRMSATETDQRTGRGPLDAAAEWSSIAATRCVPVAMR